MSEELKTTESNELEKGGPGSGNFGHGGRPGEVGGSGGGTGGKTGGIYEKYGKKSSISKEYDVKEEDLQSNLNSQKIEIDGEDVFVSRGIGYYPKGGGQAKMFDGKVVVGPEDWVGKDAHEIDEIVESVDTEFSKLSGEVVGGDFSKAVMTEDNHIIAKNLQMYKSPMTYQHGDNVINVMTDAYLNNDKVKIKKNFGEKLDNLEKEKVFAEKYLSENPDSSLGKDFLENYSKDVLSAKLMAIQSKSLLANQVNQESVNQFVSEVNKTQDYLKENYSNGKITLFRGVQGEYAKEIKSSAKSFSDDDILQVKTNTLTSWSSNEFVAKKFAGKKGVLIKQEVDISNVLFSHKTSPYIRTSDYLFGGNEEYEFIVGNNKGFLELKKENLIYD